MRDTLRLRAVAAPVDPPQGRQHQGSAGLTVSEVAVYLRVSEDKVRSWLGTGELIGFNTAASLAARPRWVISGDSLTDFTRRRSSAPTPKQKRRREPAIVDYFPGD